MQRDEMVQTARRGGLSLAAATGFVIEGADPVVATPLHLGEVSSVALGLVGQEASRIGVERGLPPQRLEVHVAHAIASLHSFLYLRVAAPPGVLDPQDRRRLTRIVECRDGRFVHLHGSFDDPALVLGALSLSPHADDATLDRELSMRDAFEVEDDLAAGGRCGAVCRTPQEWRAHPQGQDLAGRPVVEVTRIGDGPVTPWSSAPRPLSGLRVLDLTRVLAGPTVARTLAEHGADVLHVSAPHLPTVPLFEIDTGHGKRQASLDLRAPDERGRLDALLDRCDVFSQSYQFGALERFGLGASALARRRPGLVYVSVNAYGHHGPWRARPGWEQLAQAATGVCVQQSAPVPSLVPAAMNDYVTGYLGALGVLLALQRRATEGGSWHVQVSLARTAMWFQDIGADLDATAASGLDDQSGFCATVASGYGELRYLRPALSMSETPPRYTRAARPLGTDAPVWEEPDG